MNLISLGYIFYSLSFFPFICNSEVHYWSCFENLGTIFNIALSSGIFLFSQVVLDRWDLSPNQQTDTRLSKSSLTGTISLFLLPCVFFILRINLALLLDPSFAVVGKCFAGNIRGRTFACAGCGCVWFFSVPILFHLFFSSISIVTTTMTNSRKKAQAIYREKER